MDESILLRELGQVSSEDAGVVFRAYLRGCVRQMLTDVMAAEVTELCGAKHRPSESDHFRAGSSPGRILHEGQREEVVRPRVRKRLPDGSSEEVTLATYTSANNPDELHASIVTALVAGVSTRSVQSTHAKSPGVGRSNVSRLWQEVGHQFVDALREKDIATQDWVVLLLDGIRLSKDETAIVAAGITAEGEKCVLDFELGSSENAEVCRGMRRLDVDHNLVRRTEDCDYVNLASKLACNSRMCDGDALANAVSVGFLHVLFDPLLKLVDIDRRKLFQVRTQSPPSFFHVDVFNLGLRHIGVPMN